MGYGPNIGKRLKLGNLGFQGFILLLMFGQTFVQRYTFLDNTCQRLAPAIKFIKVCSFNSLVFYYYLPETAGLQVFISTNSEVFLEQ
jgi:hypothetical protein